MSRTFKQLVMMTAVVAALPMSAYSLSDTRDVVVNKDQHAVHNTFGNCVRSKWDAGQDKCAPKAVAAAPVPQPHSRSYLVFFDFDKSVLTPDSLSILSTAYNDSRAKHATSFTVTGHADRSGTVPYNIRLSEKRTEAVRDQLTKLGANNIRTASKGESEPLVPTADGVREPQNRRAEIIYYYAQ